MTPLIIASFVFLALSAWFSASETAYTSVNPLRVRCAAEEGDPAARRAKTILDQYDTMLSANLVGNNLVNIALASTATLLATRLFGAASVLSTLAVTLIVFLFGELLPKSFAKAQSERLALTFSAPTLGVMRLMKPVTALLSRYVAYLSRRFPEPDEPSYTEDELQDIIETVEDEGVLEPDQSELMQSAFDFDDIVARDIFVPMDAAVTIPIGATDEEILRVIDENGYSRYPVVEPDGRVAGMLRASRYLANRIAGDRRSLRAQLLRMRVYPAGMHIDDLMNDMNRHRAHMALLVDARETPIGIVTMEDILEELVGEIYDEDDATGGGKT